MMRSLKLLIPSMILLGAFLASSSSSYGTVELAKKEKKACTVCHTKMGSKELNEAGKYYQKNKTLDGYKK